MSKSTSHLTRSFLKAIAPKNGPRIREALQKVINITNNDEVKKRVTQALTQI